MIDFRKQLPTELGAIAYLLLVTLAAKGFAMFAPIALNTPPATGLVMLAFISGLLRLGRLIEVMDRKQQAKKKGK